MNYLRPTFLLLLMFSILAGCSKEEPSAETTHDHSATVTPVADSGAKEAPADDTAEREVLYWRAPMDPNETYDRPGTSRMGMDLVPVYADEVARAREGVVAIDPVTIQNMGVRTAPVSIQSLRREIRTTGRFEMDEQGTKTVSLKVGGWVETLHADYEGAIVRKGQPLLELYSPELVSAQEEYLLALRNARRLEQGPAAQDAQRLLDAARRRLTYWDLTDEQIRHLEATGTPQRTLTFYAPASGEVMRKRVAEGQHVNPGQALMDIVDTSQVWLIVDVYEQDLAWVDVGTSARIELPYQPDQTFQGRVDHIYYMLDPETRSAEARITLPGGHHAPIKPGMYATVYLQGTATTPGPVVPEEAVVRTGEREVVVLALGEGRFRPVEVRAGLESQGKVHILEGLNGDEHVVTSAQFLIDSEARLKSAVSAMRE